MIFCHDRLKCPDELFFHNEIFKLFNETLTKALKTNPHCQTIEREVKLKIIFFILQYILQ